MKFGRNIKKIRTIKKLSQTAFAEIFELKRSSIGAYEEERAEPKLETIIKIATYFNISIDSLVNDDITVNELVNFYLLDELLQSKKGTPSNRLFSISFTESKQLLVKTLEQTILKSEQKITLPNLKKNDLAIEIERTDFEYIPSNIKSKDIIIIDSTFNLGGKQTIGNRLFIIKHKNNLSIGEIKIRNNQEVLLIKNHCAPIYMKILELDFIAPIDTHISNSPKIKHSESEQLQKLEHLVNDLYKRL